MYGHRMFRERSIVRSAEPEPLDEPAQVTAPHEWVLMAGLALLLTGTFGWALFGSVQRTLVGDGVLLRSGERIAVLSSVSGSVAEVLASVGDSVIAGAPLARVQQPELDLQLRIVRARTAKLEEQLAVTHGGEEAERLREALATARVELLELVTLEAVRGVIVSSHAGELSALSLTPGQAITTDTAVGEVLVGTGHRLEAVLILDAERARLIEEGMAAYVTPVVPLRTGPRSFLAEVAYISPQRVAAPPWLDRLGIGLEPGGSNHLVRLTLTDNPKARVPDGVPCRVEIILKQSPLLDVRRSL